jgi:phage terminase small subunit
MRRLSKDEIFELGEEDMSEIINDFMKAPGRWNAEQMKMPSHHELATADIWRRQELQRAHDEKLRAELAVAEAAKGSALTPAERLIVFAALSK